jgi:hypothetical protein
MTDVRHTKVFDYLFGHTPPRELTVNDLMAVRIRLVQLFFRVSP